MFTIGLFQEQLVKDFLSTPNPDGWVKYGKPVCSELVNYYGQQSRKGFEWRGLALLWLTPSEIVLVRLVPLSPKNSPSARCCASNT